MVEFAGLVGGGVMVQRQRDLRPVIGHQKGDAADGAHRFHFFAVERSDGVAGKP